ncbi:calphotin-like [Helianthus annuus]|uniref:calphotin-like n=1 Tax=Helianthus annuus TaxID=4232 RepID=UPI001652FF27|nr:calphotin-like [Helianthus annuus]
MPLDVVSDDDVDLFEEDPPEADHEGEAPIAADVILPIADAPAEEDIEFIHLDQPLEEPVAPVDPLFDGPADFDMEFVDPEPAVAPEPVAAPDPALEHDPVHDDAPVVAPFVDNIPITDHHVVAPPLVDDHVADAPIDAPLLIEDPVIAPFPDPVPVMFDRAPFATHIDPRYADTRNGWIDDDDDYPPFVLPVTPPAAPVLAPALAPISAPTDIPLIPPYITDTHRTDLPVTFLQDIPPPLPGEGSSRQPPIPVPPMLSSPFPFTSQFPTVAPSTAPSFTPSSEPFLWTTPPIMPLSDPYHPYYVGYSTEDILTSLMIQQEALTRRIQGLERAQRPPCRCQTPLSASHPPRPHSPDSDVRFLISEQQIAYLLRKMPPRHDPRMPTNEAELQGIIAAAIAQYAASHAETSGNISQNHGNNNPPNGNVKLFEIYYDTFGYL